ncbi:MAG: flagellar FlbD family protein [Ruminiclostridium sp.]|nr:flagellar FlbD family protein [Ruminiclostridium sp.]
MVILTKLNGKDIMINEDRIENVVETPDTVITMENGHNYIVQESLEEIMRRIVAFNRAGHARSGREGPRES